MESFYEFNDVDFDIDLLLDYQNKKIIESTNYSTIMQACEDCLQYSRMYGIVAEPGYGKSSTFEHFILKNKKNVHYIALKRAMSNKDFYNKILERSGWSNVYRTSKLYDIIESIGYHLAQLPGKHLLIIDEAGKLSHNQRLCLHDLRDAVKGNTGVILAGPNYFHTELLDQKSKQLQGIPELFRRIDMFVTLDPPSNNEKRELFRQNGFKNQLLINSASKSCEHLGDVYRTVENFAILAERRKS